MGALSQKFTMKTGVFLLLIAAFSRGLAQTEENAVEELQVETLVKPETCSVLSEMGDTLQIHYTGKLMDGKVIDTSLSRDPLVVELGKRTVIPGLEQSLLGVCEGQKIKATIPSHLAYGKKGYPPTIPGMCRNQSMLRKIIKLHNYTDAIMQFWVLMLTSNITKTN
ncbi:peptidyl-prolyl cis-trans isomerase FKBP11 isoform 2-T2 [Menidia menidia]